MIITGIGFFCSIAIGVGASSTIYLQLYTFGFDFMVVGQANIINGVICMILSLFIGALAVRFDKRKASIVGILGWTIGGLIILFGKSTTFGAFIFATFFINLGVATFWSQIFALLSDVVEVDIAKTSKSREGIMTALLSVGLKVGTAFGMFITGFGLSIIGFSEQVEIQTESAIAGIRTVYGIGVGAATLAAVILLILYPYTRERMTEILNDNKRGNI